MSTLINQFDKPGVGYVFSYRTSRRWEPFDGKSKHKMSEEPVLQLLRVLKQEFNEDVGEQYICKIKAMLPKLADSHLVPGGKGENRSRLAITWRS